MAQFMRVPNLAMASVIGKYYGGIIINFRGCFSAVTAG